MRQLEAVSDRYSIKITTLFGTVQNELSQHLLLILVVAAEHRHRQLLQLLRAERALGRSDLRVHTVLDQLAHALQGQVLLPAQLGEAYHETHHGAPR